MADDTMNAAIRRAARRSSDEEVAAVRADVSRRLTGRIDDGGAREHSVPPRPATMSDLIRNAAAAARQAPAPAVVFAGPPVKQLNVRTEQKES
jgi:hypothetical protein